VIYVTIGKYNPAERNGVYVCHVFILPQLNGQYLTHKLNMRT